MSLRGARVPLLAENSRGVRGSDHPCYRPGKPCAEGLVLLDIAALEEG